MALEVKLGQDLRLRQQLVMTPQLQQAIKILQLSLPELEAVVQTELDSNPVLEPLDTSPAENAPENSSNSDEDFTPPPDGELSEEREAAPASADEPPNEWDAPPGSEELPVTASEARDAAVEMEQFDRIDKLDWREYMENYSNNWQEAEPADPDDERRQTVENTLTRKTSLEDHLMWQLRLSSLTEMDQRIGATIIYNLNDDGYLETPLAELAAQLEVSEADVDRVLKRVQQLDPPGAVARDLRECLLLQLKNLGMEESLAARVVSNHLDLLEKHRYNEIAKLLGVSVEAVNQAQKIISLLEPKPGRDYGGEEPTYVIPDVFIVKMGNDYVVTLESERGAAAAAGRLLSARDERWPDGGRNQGISAGAAALGQMAGEVDLSAPADHL